LWLNLADSPLNAKTAPSFVHRVPTLGVARRLVADEGQGADRDLDATETTQ